MPKPLPREVQAAIARLVAANGGIIRSADWLRAGLDPGLLSHRARPGGPWQRVLRGVYVTHSGPLTTDQRLRAGYAYCGAGSVVTGLGALLHLSRFDQRLPDQLTFLIPHGRRRQSSTTLEVERTRYLPDPVGGLVVPAAPVARAVVDACRRLDSADRVRHLVGLAVQRRTATVSDLLAALEQSPRTGTALLREALSGASAGVRGAEEHRVRELLLQRGIRDVQWNVHLYAADGTTWLAYVDGWVRGRYLETQTRAWHLYVNGAWEGDLARMTRLGLHDAVPILATKAAVTSQPELIVAAVRKALDDPDPRCRIQVGRAPAWWGQRAA